MSEYPLSSHIVRTHGKFASALTLAALSSGMAFTLPLSAYSSPAAPAKTASTPKKQYPMRIEAAIRLYQNLEYEAALGQFEAAKATAEKVEDFVVISLYQGIIFANLRQPERSRAAFQDALRLRPFSALPVPVSPKIAAEFQALREELHGKPLVMPPKQSPVDAVPSEQSPPLVASHSQPSLPPARPTSLPGTPAASTPAQSTPTNTVTPALDPPTHQPLGSSLEEAHASAPLSSPPLPSRGSLIGRRALMVTGGAMSLAGVVRLLTAQNSNSTEISAQESVGGFLGAGGALLIGVGLILELSAPSEASTFSQSGPRPAVSLQRQGIVVGTWMPF